MISDFSDCSPTDLIQKVKVTSKWFEDCTKLLNNGDDVCIYWRKHRTTNRHIHYLSSHVQVIHIKLKKKWVTWHNCLVHVQSDITKLYVLRTVSETESKRLLRDSKVTIPSNLTSCWWHKIFVVCQMREFLLFMFLHAINSSYNSVQ